MDDLQLFNPVGRLEVPSDKFIFIFVGAASCRDVYRGWKPLPQKNQLRYR
jgi:hypothetical protein